MNKILLYGGGGVVVVFLGYEYLKSRNTTTAQTDSSGAGVDQYGLPVAVYSGVPGTSSTDNSVNLPDVSTPVDTSSDNALKQSLMDTSTIATIFNSLVSMGNSFLGISVSHDASGNTAINVTPNTELDNLKANNSLIENVVSTLTGAGQEVKNLDLSHTASGITLTQIQPGDLQPVAAQPQNLSFSSDIMFKNLSGYLNALNHTTLSPADIQAEYSIKGMSPEEMYSKYWINKGISATTDQTFNPKTIGLQLTNNV